MDVRYASRGGCFSAPRRTGPDAIIQRRRRGPVAARRRVGKAPSEMPSFQPYWGKPAVRNDRGDRGDVGIIRSPVRASILPDRGGCAVMCIPTAILGDEERFLPARLSAGFLLRKETIAGGAAMGETRRLRVRPTTASRLKSTLSRR